MLHIVMVVIALGLVISVMLAGINYVSPDIAVRAIAYERVAYSASVVGQATVSYRRANGVMPREESWRNDISPYLPGGVMPDLQGMDWSYLTTATGPRLCLSTPQETNLTQPVHAGIVKAAGGQASVRVAKRCDASQEDRSFDGQVALILEL